MPPVLPEREPRGAVIEKDEKLDQAIKQCYVFTDTTQHMDDKVCIVVTVLYCRKTGTCIPRIDLCTVKK